MVKANLKCSKSENDEICTLEYSEILKNGNRLKIVAKMCF